MHLKNKTIASLIVLAIGIILSIWVYFSTSFSPNPIGQVQDSHIKDVLVNKTQDSYENKDEVREQTLHIKILSGKHKSKIYVVKNSYSPSQAMTQKYYPHQRLIVTFIKNKPKIMSPKRDWVVVFSIALVLSLLIYISGKHSILLTFSMILNSLIFYFVIRLDIAENGTQIFAIYGAAVVLFTII